MGLIVGVPVRSGPVFGLGVLVVANQIGRYFSSLLAARDTEVAVLLLFRAVVLNNCEYPASPRAGLNGGCPIFRSDRF